MATAKKSTRSRTRSVGKKKSAEKARHSEVVGITSDGVTILRPKAKPTHFTAKQIRETIREVLKLAPAKR
jgi:hypothetical protein